MSRFNLRRVLITKMTRGFPRASEYGALLSAVNPIKPYRNGKAKVIVRADGTDVHADSSCRVIQGHCTQSASECQLKTCTQFVFPVPDASGKYNDLFGGQQDLLPPLNPGRPPRDRHRAPVSGMPDMITLTGRLSICGLRATPGGTAGLS